MDERHEAALAMAGRLAGVTFHGGSHGNMHALCEALAGAPFVGTVEACEALRDRLADVLGHCPDSNATCPDGNGTCPIRAGSSEVRAGSSGGGRDAVATRERQAVADDVVARSDDGVPPVTSDLRLAMVQHGWADGSEVTFTDLQPSLDAEPFLTICGGRFTNLCDAIDALHASLEDENGRLRAGRDRMAEELARVMAECDGLRDELEAEREESLARHEELTAMGDVVVGDYARLPEDAHGEVIRVGDVMRYADYHDDVNEVGTFCVESLHLLADGSWMVMDDGPLYDHAPQQLVHTDERRELLRELVARSMGVEGYRNGVAVLEVIDEFFDEFLDEHPELLGGDGR